jgi:Fic family protein
VFGSGRHLEIVKTVGGPAPDGRYLHWDQLRHREPPEGLTRDEWWLGIKLARSPLLKDLPVRSAYGQPFQLALPEAVLEAAQHIDEETRGIVPLRGHQVTQEMRINALMEEAIQTAQLAGAAMARRDAKGMLRSGATPRNRSEWMIHDAYQALNLVSEARDEKLTPVFVNEVHRAMTAHTLIQGEAGRLRQAHEEPQVYTLRGERLFTPPPAKELKDRLAGLCAFAIGDTPDWYIHPVVRTILVHLWVGYDHFFVEGNGRVARALGLWSALSRDYALFDLLPVSRRFRGDKGAYERVYLYTTSDGYDATYFVFFVLRALQESVEAFEAWAWRRREEVARATRAVGDSQGLNARQLSLLGQAVRHTDPRYTIRTHQARFGVAYKTARRDLRRLQKRGLLTRKRVGRIHVFRPTRKLKKAIAAETKAPAPERVKSA